MAERSDRPVLVVGIDSPHVLRFVAGLLDAGVPMVVVTNHSRPFLQRWPDLKVVTTPLTNRSFRSAAVIRAAIRRWSPRLIHAHQADAVGWHATRAAKGTGTPVLVTIWGSDVLLTPRRSAIHRWAVRSTLRAAIGWTSDARMLLEAAEALTGETSKPRALIPFGVSRINAETPDRSEQWILSNRLHERVYRVDAVINAFAKLPPEFATWRLEVAGRGTQTAALTELATSLGVADRVVFTGFLAQEQLQNSYRRSAVFVSVPRTDGTSVSLLEAMAAGCVPVVSDVPANREWIVDGLNGRLVLFDEDPAPLLANVLAQAIRWSEQPAWTDGVIGQNRALVSRTALFADNVRQFVEFQQRVTGNP